MPTLYVRTFLAICLLQLGFGTPAALAEGPGEVQAPLIQKVADGVFVMGNVHIDANTREVSFPAKVNMQEGTIEYLIVTEIGKTHESLLVADIEPYHLQAAMLMLGIKGAQLPDPSDAPASALDPQTIAKMPPITGDPLRISFTWGAAEKQQTSAADKWILTESGKKIPQDPWLYSGSRFFQGDYLAQLNGSLASLITDADAMINSRRLGKPEDSVYIPNKSAVPDVGTAVKVKIALPDPKQKNP